jgi:AraC-like DNA-binding protein/ABC-type sugar transport system substrate-binding protein
VTVRKRRFQATPALPSRAVVSPRLGLWIGADEPFFVQVRVALERAAARHSVEIVYLDDDFDSSETSLEWRHVAADIAASRLDLFVCNFLPLPSLEAILERGVRVVHLGETKLRHPHLVSLEGLYDAGRAGGLFLAGHLAQGARVLAVGGGHPYPESGMARLEGVRDGLSRRADVHLEHVAAPWSPDTARAVLEPHLNHAVRPWDAIFALSDPLALLVRDLTRATLAVHGETLLLGINGDPLALAAIVRGDLSATVDVDTDRIGERAVALALQLARGEPAPTSFEVATRLVTRDNASDVTTRKLVALADLPSRLVGVNLSRERKRQARLEASLEIGQRIARTLERAALVRNIPEDVRFAYGYDEARFFTLLPDGTLRLEDTERRRVLQLRDPLGVAVLERRALFIADAQRNTAFERDPELEGVHTRTVLPVEAGGVVLGVLDLHATRSAPHARSELIGLRWIADQLGAGLRFAALLEERAGVSALAVGAPPSTPEPRASARSGRLRRMGRRPSQTVLVAAPELRDRERLRHALRNDVAGVVVHTTGDGLELLEHLARGVPEAVVLTPELPKMDGYSVLAWMRARADLAGVGVLMLGEQPLTDATLRLLEHPRVVWLGKGVLNDAELRERIEDLRAGRTLALRSSFLVKRCLFELHAGYAQAVSRDDLASRLGVTPNHLSHLFKAETGLSPWTYLTRVRLEASKALLRAGRLDVASVAQAAGFNDASYYARMFVGMVGVTPSRFRSDPDSADTR